MKSFRVRFLFPALQSHRAEQEIRAEAGNWAAALGKAAREVRERPDIKGKRIHEFSVRVTELDETRRASEAE